MSEIASQITSLTIVYSTVLSLRVTGLCVGNSPVTGEFPAQMASNAENISIWWRHHETARVIIDPGDGLVPSRWQPITWTNND